MNNNNFGDSEYAHNGPGCQINAAGGTVNNTVYHGGPGTPIQVQDCWKSLAFKEMNDRYHDIDAAQPGTCNWLSPHEIYREWVKGSRGLLWIKGKPGSGKSTLLRHALDNAKKRCNIEEKPLILSFFFHGRGTELQRTPPGFYRSLLHQLRQIPDAVSDVVNTFKENCETVGEVGKTWQWHPKQLHDLFQSSILEAIKLRPIYLFVDALDECGEVDAAMLARKFKDLLDSLQSTAHKPFRICFTCRPYPILTLNSVFEICVEKKNRTDIYNFVQCQLSDVRPTIRDLITKRITERADGVFLWASLIVKRISSLNRKVAKLEAMEAAILPVPQELDALYLELTKEMGLDSLRLIQCVCVAMKPLSIDALRWAMAIKTKPPYSSLKECRHSPNYQPDDESMKRRIQTLSHGLVEVTSKKKVQFIHQTVKDFFVEKGLLKLKRPNRVPLGTSESDYAVGMAHDEMSKICVRYLVMEDEAQVNPRAYIDSMERYALKMWVAHVQRSEQRGISQDDLLDCFVAPSQTLRRLYIELYGAYHGDPTVLVIEGICLSHVASVYGLTGLLQAMLKMTSRTKSMMNEKDMFGRTPLVLAAGNGHKATARLLLEHGADIDTKDKAGRTPLKDAIASGHEGIVQLLLKHGADINTKDEAAWTPLKDAIAGGHEGIVQLLLEHGADINTKDEAGRTPLKDAIASSYEGIVQLMLEHRADINTKDKAGRTPLMDATAGGHEGIVQLLLKHGADINTKDKEGETPLVLAAEGGHESILQLLLEHGADINTAGWTPLMNATAGGHEGIVQLLLEHGADINTKDKEGETPLVLAAEGGHESILQLLLEHGADINTAGWTPLSIAANKRDKRTLQLLLKYRDGRNAKAAANREHGEYLKSGVYCRRTSKRGHVRNLRS